MVRGDKREYTCTNVHERLKHLFNVRVTVVDPSRDYTVLDETEGGR